MNILLHICCGVCAAGVAGELKAKGHKITGIFYNPNIFPREEYDKRLQAVKEVSVKADFPLIVLDYEYDNWLKDVIGHEKEPEGGSRCPLCFAARFKKVYNYFCGHKEYDLFTTTLTVSPMKRAQVVNAVGDEIAGDKFLCADFKKKEGFKKAVARAKEWGIYRQHYCGCEFSVRDKDKNSKH